MESKRVERGILMEETNYRNGLNPFTAVWIRTREAVRYAIEEKSDGFIWLLVALSGISGALLTAPETRTDGSFPVWGIILIAVIAGPIGGVISSAISAGAFLLIGRLFSGTATFTDMFRAVVTAQIPQIWLLPFAVLLLAVPPVVPSEPGAVAAGGALSWSLAVAVFLFAMSIWIFIIQCKAVGEAHRISSWKGFFILLLTWVFIFILIIVLAMLFISVAANGR